MKVPLRSVIFLLSLSLICLCEASSPTPSSSVLAGDVGLAAVPGVSSDASASAEHLDSSLLEDGQRTVSLPSSIFYFLSLFVARFLSVNGRGLRDVNKRS